MYRLAGASHCDPYSSVGNGDRTGPVNGRYYGGEALQRRLNSLLRRTSRGWVGVGYGQRVGKAADELRDRPGSYIAPGPGLHRLYGYGDGG